MSARTKQRAAVHLEASQGVRLAEPPTHDSKMAEMQKWTAILPPPPRPFGEQDEIALQAWLTDVAEKGGIDGLRWCYHPDVWPFGLAMRSRVQHIVGGLIRGIEHQQKLKVEQAAREMAAKQQHAQRDLMREKGWK